MHSYAFLGSLYANPITMHTFQILFQILFSGKCIEKGDFLNILLYADSHHYDTTSTHGGTGCKAIVSSLLSCEK